MCTRCVRGPRCVRGVVRGVLLEGVANTRMHATNERLYVHMQLVISQCVALMCCLVTETEIARDRNSTYVAADCATWLATHLTDRVDTVSGWQRCHSALPCVHVLRHSQESRTRQASYRTRASVLWRSVRLRRYDIYTCHLDTALHAENVNEPCAMASNTKLDYEERDDIETGGARGGIGPLATSNRFAILEVRESAPHDTNAFQDVV